MFEFFSAYDLNSLYQEASECLRGFLPTTDNKIKRSRFFTLINMVDDLRAKEENSF